MTIQPGHYFQSQFIGAIVSSYKCAGIHIRMNMKSRFFFASAFFYVIVRWVDTAFLCKS